MTFGIVDIFLINQYIIEKFWHTRIIKYNIPPYEQAIQVPIKIEKGVKIHQLQKGQIEIENIVGRYQIEIGSPTALVPGSGETVLFCKKGGKLIFKGRAYFGNGTVLRVDKNAEIRFGDGFFCNSNTFIRSDNLISFGQTCRVGWNVSFNTTDGHIVKKNNHFIEKSVPIIFGNKVWVGAYSVIGKGVELADHCIVGQGSIVTRRKVDEPYTLIHGASVVKSTERYELTDF